MEDVRSYKAAGVDKLYVFKRWCWRLEKPVSALCNLPICRWVFPSACKVPKSKPIFKKGKKTDLSTDWFP